MAKPKRQYNEISRIGIIQGVEGNSVYINDLRVCGAKPWGGGKYIAQFEKVETKDILEALGLEDLEHHLEEAEGKTREGKEIFTSQLMQENEDLESKLKQAEARIKELKGMLAHIAIILADADNFPENEIFITINKVIQQALVDNKT
jgi:hypothetical protein